MGWRMIDVLHYAIRKLATDRLNGGYEALLEADISGWLFHYILTAPDVDANKLHLDARVVGVNGFIDLVSGPVDYDAEKKPAIGPRLAVEMKLFPRVGFTPQQHRVHFEHVINDDLRKLGCIRLPSCSCAQLLVDGKGYLRALYGKANRLDVVTRQRDRVAPHADLFVLHLSGGVWRVVHKPPAQTGRATPRPSGLWRRHTDSLMQRTRSFCSSIAPTAQPCQQGLSHRWPQRAHAHCSDLGKYCGEAPGLRERRIGWNLERQGIRAGRGPGRLKC